MTVPIDGITRREPGDIAPLVKLADDLGFALPADYLDFLSESDGGDGMVGVTWLELWPVERVLEAAELEEPPYEEVLMFAGDGANTVYGFDLRTGEIIEGDWIGLGRDELIRHGRSLAAFLRSIAR